MANTSYEKQLERVQAQLARKKEELRRLLRRQRAEKRKAEDKRMLARGKLLESLIDGADTLTDREITDILTTALAPSAPLPSIIMPFLHGAVCETRGRREKRWQSTVAVVRFNGRR